MPRILILEDEKVVARDLQRLVTEIGYETSLASSGEEALELAKRSPLDLALVDIHLAGTLDGIETARMLRQQMDLAVVYLTAYADDQTLERAKTTEPCGYLVKPFDESTLRATLRMAAHKGSIERSNRIEQQRQSDMLDHLTVGLISADRSGMVKMMNARARWLTGWSEQEAVGKDLAQVLTICNPKKSSITGDVLRAALQGEKECAAEGPLNVISKTGKETPVELKVSPIEDERHRVVGACLVFWTAGAAEQQRVPAPRPGEPDTDPVTGLPGRAQATALLESMYQQQSHLFAAPFVLDGYGVTAQKFGVRLADDVLTYYCIFLAQKLLEELDAKTLFRWTGPCLLAVFGPLDSLQSAQREITRCTNVTLERIIDLPSRMLLLPISASTAVFPINDMSPEELISQIDTFVAIQTKGVIK